MADRRPANRPRRAFSGAEATAPTTGPETGSQSEATTDAEAAARKGGPSDAASDGHFTEDEARPIFREDAADADASTVRTSSPAVVGRSRADDGSTGLEKADDADDEAGDEAAESADSAEADGEDAGAKTSTRRTRRLNFTPRAAPVDDAESTTLLPRTVGAGDTLGDLDVDDDRPHRLSSRTRLALLAAVVVVVVVAGIALGTQLIGGRATGAGEAPSSSTQTSAASPSAVALLDDASMLSVTGAQSIDPRRTWTVASTVRGDTPDAPAAACLGGDPLEGAPTAQQTISQTLSSSGSKAPAALHVASAYPTAEDAAQAFSVTARALGTCAVSGDYLASGRVVSGTGDEAVAALASSTGDGDETQHWVVVSRTGRVLDVVDASQPGTALNVNNVNAAVTSVIAVQCTTSGGACATSPSTTDGPPPAGGDEPGFLASGDLPPIGSTTAPWVGTPVEPPTEDFTGSQCETVNWSTTAATDKNARVYLLQDVPGIFGLNEIVLTEKDADTASKLVDKVRSDWTTCKERKLTAAVQSPTKVTGVGADAAAISGWTTEVQQQAGSTTTRFRVGIASSGNMVAFTFLNPQKGLDVTGDQWNVIAVRAVQRATQTQ